jgi:DNA-nicking Smr family endonuclease
VSRRRRGGEDESFASAMGDATPLEDRKKIRTPPAAPKSTPPAAAAEAQRFALEMDGNRIEGRAADVARKTLSRLRRGEFPPDAELDLHGLDARQARRTLVERLEAASARGNRCVLVVHGRGRHSEAAPVLRSELPGWLQERPLAALVMAFCTAPANRGGSGALLVLLRRAR